MSRQQQILDLAREKGIVRAEDVEAWNTRPIEDSLRSELEVYKARELQEMTRIQKTEGDLFKANYDLVQAEAKLTKEKETRIKYQDIVYSVCNLLDAGKQKITIDEIVQKITEMVKRIKELEGKVTDLSNEAYEYADKLKQADARVTTMQAVVDAAVAYEQASSEYKSNDAQQALYRLVFTVRAIKEVISNDAKILS